MMSLIILMTWDLPVPAAPEKNTFFFSKIAFNTSNCLDDNDNCFFKSSSHDTSAPGPSNELDGE
jgi:hypothetical protein